jgi:hypothetical protein
MIITHLKSVHFSCFNCQLMLFSKSSNPRCLTGNRVYGYGRRQREYVACYLENCTNPHHDHEYITKTGFWGHQTHFSPIFCILSVTETLELTFSSTSYSLFSFSFALNNRFSEDFSSSMSYIFDFASIATFSEDPPLMHLFDFRFHSLYFRNIYF